MTENSESLKIEVYEDFPIDEEITGLIIRTKSMKDGEALKDKINGALENQELLNDIGMEIVFHKDYLALQQNSHTDECRKAVEFYRIKQLQEFAYTEAFDKLLNDSFKLQQAQQKLAKIESKIKSMSNDHSIVCNGHCCDLHQVQLLDFLQSLSDTE